MPDTYVCAACGGRFAKTWTDAEAMLESKDIFGDIPREDLVQVCDDCFQHMMAALN